MLYSPSLVKAVEINVPSPLSPDHSVEFHVVPLSTVYSISTVPTVLSVIPSHTIVGVVSFVQSSVLIVNDVRNNFV